MTKYSVAAIGAAAVGLVLGLLALMSYFQFDSYLYRLAYHWFWVWG